MKYKCFVDFKKGKLIVIYIFNFMVFEFFYVMFCIGRDKKKLKIYFLDCFK